MRTRCSCSLAASSVSISVTGSPLASGTIRSAPGPTWSRTASGGTGLAAFTGAVLAGDGEGGLDAGARRRAPPDLEPPAGQRDPLAHPHEAEALCRLLGLEADAVVGDRQPHVAVLAPDLDGHRAGPGVLG